MGNPSYIVAGLRLIDLEEDLGEGLPVSGNLRISRDPEFLNKLLVGNCSSAMGDLEFGFIKSAGAYVYSVEEPLGAETVLPTLNERMAEIALFLTASWLVIDNAVDTEMVYAVHDFEDTRTVSSNFVGRSRTLSDGTRPVLRVTKENLELMRTVFSYLFNLVDSKTKASIGSSKNLKRAVRSLYFAQMAREQSDLALKISVNCSALEALLSTVSAEISHQLAERTAVVAAINGPTRTEVYRDIKKAYGIRSATLHGSGIKESVRGSLADISKSTDRHLRICLSRAIGVDPMRDVLAGGQETINEYFLKELLDDPSAKVETQEAPGTLGESNGEG